MQRDRLVIRDVPPSFTLAGEELGVETPRDDRVDCCVIGAVDIVLFRDCEELALAAAGSGSVVRQY